MRSLMVFFSPLHYLYHLSELPAHFLLKKLQLSSTLHFSVTPENTNMNHSPVLTSLSLPHGFLTSSVKSY